MQAAKPAATNGLPEQLGPGDAVRNLCPRTVLRLSAQRCAYHHGSCRATGGTRPFQWGRPAAHQPTQVIDYKNKVQEPGDTAGHSSCLDEEHPPPPGAASNTKRDTALSRSADQLRVIAEGHVLRRTCHEFVKNLTIPISQASADSVRPGATGRHTDDLRPREWWRLLETASINQAITSGTGTIRSRSATPATRATSICPPPAVAR